MKIIKAPNNFWYAKRIGEEYEVVGYDDKTQRVYKVIEDSEFGIMRLYVDDCEIIDNSPYKVNWKYEIKRFIRVYNIMRYVWIGIVIAAGLAYALLLK